MHNYSAIPRRRSLDGRVLRGTGGTNGQVAGGRLAAGGAIMAARADSRERVLRLRAGGMSIQQISYLTGVPRSTVGDWVKADHSSLLGPAPFWRLVDF